MNRGAAVLVVVAVVALARMALADRTSVVYAPTDGGSAVVSNLVSRKAAEIFNAETVAVCVTVETAATPTAPCRPIVPGGSMSIDVSDAHRFYIRRCSDTTVASCLGDGGVVVTEIQ